jgi:phosphorylcholine metabolism protein LicD
MNNELFKILETYNVQWWLDSGSLLGIYRDGQFLAGDKDIDISFVFKENRIEIENLVKKIAQLGFRVVVFQWNNVAYKYKLIPLRKYHYSVYKVDINIYYDSTDMIISPQLVKNKVNNFIIRIKQKAFDIRKGNSFLNDNNSFYNILKSLFLKIVMFFTPDYLVLNMDKYYPARYKLYKWQIPKSLLFPLVKYKDDYIVPFNTEAYLEFRYGNWKIPNSDWNFTEDDGGLFQSNAEEISLLLNREDR